MRLRWSLGLILVMFAAAGCASTKQPSPLSQLEIQVAQLENNLEERDQEISDLKYEVESLSNEVDRLSGTSSKPVTVVMQTPPSSGAVEGEPSGDYGDIIRVAVSAMEVQTALKSAGFYSGDVDGKIGAKTKSAIAEFQRANGLKDDGIVGKKTWAELEKYLK